MADRSLSTMRRNRANEVSPLSEGRWGGSYPKPSLSTTGDLVLALDLRIVLALQSQSRYQFSAVHP